LVLNVNSSNGLMLVLLPKGLIDLLDKLRLSYLIGRGLGRGRDRVMLLVLGGGGMDERSYTVL